MGFYDQFQLEAECSRRIFYLKNKAPNDTLIKRDDQSEVSKSSEIYNTRH